MQSRAIFLAAVWLITAAPVVAGDKAVEAPIAKFSHDFNVGDMAGAQTTMTETVAITDEFAPFFWSGKSSFARWNADNGRDMKARGITAPGGTIGTPTREVVIGNHAYVIAPATYHFVRNGVRMAEVAQMTFVVEKGAAGWKISGWTWTGPDAIRAR